MADASYLSIILRQRINEIAQEVLRLKEEHAALVRAKNKASAYQGRLETVLREVHTLEAIHADYNLALDKLRTSIDPAHLRLYLKRLKTQNTEAARGVREYVLRRQHLEHEADRLLEERTRRTETEEEKIKRFVDSKTFELYQELREQMEMLERAAQRQEEELARVKRREGEEQQEQEEQQQHPQKDDPEQQKYQQQYQALRVELRRLEGMRRYLEEEDMPLVSLWAKDREEAEAQLQTRMERDQQRADEVEDQCRVLRQGGNVGRGGGWQVVVERARKERQQAQEDANMLDVKLYSSNNTNNKNNNVSDKSIKHKAEEHAVSDDDLNPDAYNSEVIVELLKERAKRLGELKRVRVMKGRITVEINAVNKKKKTLKEEMGVWARRLLDEGGIKGGGEEEKKQLKEECLELVERLNALLCDAGQRVR